MIKAYALLALSYLLGLCAAFFLLPHLAAFHVLVQVFLADIAATFVVFSFSFVFRNSSFYDPYWSVIPVAIVAYFLWLADEAVMIRQAMVCIVIFVWAFRLTANFLYTWRGLDHEDWRYINLREQSGVLWWPLSLIGIHLLPTVIVFLGCIPLYSALVTGSQPLNVFDAAAMTLGAVSIWLEYQSDVQLHRFRQIRTSREEVLDQGLWRLCRHPNYLGELGVWFSVFLFGYAALGEATEWMTAGPVSMFLLFALVSIPMIEKKLQQDKPGYDAYRKTTFALLPLSTFRR